MSKNELTTFTFNTSNIRVVATDGNPWFVAVDVCRVLGLSNPSVAVMPLGDDEKAKSSLGSGSPANLVSESGLYKLIMRSDKPEAKAFQDWVTKVVLPSIRKDGAYVMGEGKALAEALREHELHVLTGLCPE